MKLEMMSAEGEHKASRALRHAAEVITDCPAALQTLNSISAEHNSTIVFPVPIDIISNFMTLQQPGNMDGQQQQQQQQQQQYYQQFQQFQQFQQAMQMQQQ